MYILSVTAAQPRYSQLIRQSRAVLHCAPTGLFAIKEERILHWPRHRVDETDGVKERWERERRRGREGRIEDTRGRHCEWRGLKMLLRSIKKDWTFEIDRNSFGTICHNFHLIFLFSLSTTSFPCGSLTFSPPFVSSVFSSSRIFPLLPHESPSSIFLAGYPIPHLHLTSLPLWWPTSYTDEAIVPL